MSGGSYDSGTLADGERAFGYWDNLNKLVNVPTEWTLEASRIAVNENTDDITFTGSCDIFVASMEQKFDCFSTPAWCMDLTSDDISPDICEESQTVGGNVVRGSHNCFSFGYHHAWCGVDSTGNAAVAECDIPFQHVSKIEVRNSPYVFKYTQATMLVMLPSAGKNYFAQCHVHLRAFIYLTVLSFIVIPLI